MHLLIIRFSALGDVAMTVPVIHALATDYPDLRITVLSRAAWQPLFAGMPPNVRFTGADLAGRHKGWAGQNALYAELRAMRFDCVADLHGTLRSRYLALRFRLAGIRAATIRKGRYDKYRLTRRRRKRFVQLKTSFERYADVLARLGFPVKPTFRSMLENAPLDAPDQWPLNVVKTPDERWIGIAPFARHGGKIYPPALMEQVVAQLSALGWVTIFLFGGGPYEQAVLEAWTQRYPSVESVVGRCTMHTELMLISRLDVMLSMDSANMHLASLVGTPVVSVWGATHPYAGFLGWNQREDDVVQIDLPCRPCSVFGQKPCWRGDYACLYGIDPARIADKVLATIR